MPHLTNLPWRFANVFGLNGTSRPSKEWGEDCWIELGRWLVGAVRGHRELAASGAWLASAGLVGFVGLAVFFEVVIGIGGRGSGAGGRYVLAALLILAGLALLGRRLLAARRP